MTDVSPTKGSEPPEYSIEAALASDEVALAVLGLIQVPQFAVVREAEVIMTAEHYVANLFDDESDFLELCRLCRDDLLKSGIGFRVISDQKTLSSIFGALGLGLNGKPGRKAGAPVTVARVFSLRAALVLLLCGKGGHPDAARQYFGICKPATVSGLLQHRTKRKRGRRPKSEVASVGNESILVSPNRDWKGDISLRDVLLSDEIALDVLRQCGVSGFETMPYDGSTVTLPSCVESYFRTLSVTALCSANDQNLVSADIGYTLITSIPEITQVSRMFTMDSGSVRSLVTKSGFLRLLSVRSLVLLLLCASGSYAIRLRQYFDFPPSQRLSIPSLLQAHFFHSHEGSSLPPTPRKQTPSHSPLQPALESESDRQSVDTPVNYCTEVYTYALTDSSANLTLLVAFSPARSSCHIRLLPIEMAQSTAKLQAILFSMRSYPESDVFFTDDPEAAFRYEKYYRGTLPPADVTQESALIFPTFLLLNKPIRVITAQVDSVTPKIAAIALPPETSGFF